MTKENKHQFGFIVVAPVALVIEIEASSLEEAVDIATSAGTMTLCDRCAKGNIGEWSLTSEIDVEPAAYKLREAWKDDKHLKLKDLDDIWPEGIQQ